MPRSLTFAAVQMNATPAPLSERLERAAALVRQAACAGAQLVVLPELFNTGYEYRDQNYDLAELPDGSSVTWMKNIAAQLDVHLAGSLLLRDRGEIYNAMLMLSPEGEIWRYDKTYPWVFERAYFRAGGSISVAETRLGRMGMLICWDIAHPRLWAQYAEQVQAVVVCSCPPAIHRSTLVFPDGERIPSQEAGRLYAAATRGAEDTFGAFLRRQAAWLGTPLVNTCACGQFSSCLPLAGLSLAFFALRQRRLWPYLSRLDAARLQCSYFQETYVADANGQVLARVPPESEAFALATVPLPDAPPKPTRPQPPFGLSPLAYILDALANLLFASVYASKKKQGGRQTDK